MYQINIGSDKEPIVNAAVLYKLHRIQDICEREKEPPRNRNREAIFEEISKLLEDAWRLPEEHRRQVVKRQILSWKKTFGDEEFWSEALGYIRNKISQLGGSYDKHIDAWVARAIEHEMQREECIEVGGSCHIPPRLYIRNPQPEEAKRWFRQAEADLAAVANDIASSRPSYEWACFKCHQAAEKALKAVQYAINAHNKTFDHYLERNCIGLNDSELSRIAGNLERLVVSSVRMRYPDRVSFPDIPNDVYTAQMAKQALQLSENIVMRVKVRIFSSQLNCEMEEG